MTDGRNGVEEGRKESPLPGSEPAHVAAELAASPAPEPSAPPPPELPVSPCHAAPPGNMDVWVYGRMDSCLIEEFMSHIEYMYVWKRGLNNGYKDGLL